MDILAKLLECVPLLAEDVLKFLSWDDIQTQIESSEFMRDFTVGNVAFIFLQSLSFSSETEEGEDERLRIITRYDLYSDNRNFAVSVGNRSLKRAFVMNLTIGVLNEELTLEVLQRYAPYVRCNSLMISGVSQGNLFKAVNATIPDEIKISAIPSYDRDILLKPALQRAKIIRIEVNGTENVIIPSQGENLRRLEIHSRFPYSEEEINAFMQLFLENQQTIVWLSLHSETPFDPTFVDNFAIKYEEDLDWNTDNVFAIASSDKSVVAIIHIKQNEFHFVAPGLKPNYRPEDVDLLLF